MEEELEDAVSWELDATTELEEPDWDAELLAGPVLEEELEEAATWEPGATRELETPAGEEDVPPDAVPDEELPVQMHSS